MPLTTQAKILRAAESGVVERLGGSKSIPVDVRLLSATNKDLVKAIRSGQFREDLYYRLAAATIDLPPLRNRAGDIPLLVSRFWQELRTKYSRAGPHLEPAAMASLERGAWPGNIRQLRHTLERLFVLPKGDSVTAEDVAAALAGGERPSPDSDALWQIDDLREARRIFETEFLKRKLREHGGNVSRTAQAIGLERQSLQEKLRSLGVSRSSSES
jgi:two-component system nitrogen regulation response regulator NtrX